MDSTNVLYCKFCKCNIIEEEAVERFYNLRLEAIFLEFGIEEDFYDIAQPEKLHCGHLEQPAS